MTIPEKAETEFIEYLVEQPELPEIYKKFDKLGCYEDHFGKILKIKLINSDRYFLLNIPCQENIAYPILFCYHGLSEWAWTFALELTEWRKISFINKFVIIFGQGTNCGSLVDNRNGFCIWKPDEEFIYFEEILSRLKSDEFKISLDFQKVYYFGFSNGGIFSSVLLQQYGRTIFAGICNCMGGFGKECKEVKKIQNLEIKPVRLLIITSEFDDYQESCIYAKGYFEKLNFPVVFKLLPKLSHQYPIGMEQEIWSFFINESSTI